MTSISSVFQVARPVVRLFWVLLLGCVLALAPAGWHLAHGVALPVALVLLGAAIAGVSPIWRAVPGAPAQYWVKDPSRQHVLEHYRMDSTVAAVLGLTQAGSFLVLGLGPSSWAMARDVAFGLGMFCIGALVVWRAPIWVPRAPSARG